MILSAVLAVIVEVWNLREKSRGASTWHFNTNCYQPISKGNAHTKYGLKLHPVDRSVWIYHWSMKTSW